VTFFVGENGTGKSTLIEAIAVSYGQKLEGGSLFGARSGHSLTIEFLNAVFADRIFGSDLSFR
jgi:predicted ATPase